MSAKVIAVAEGRAIRLRRLREQDLVAFIENAFGLKLDEWQKMLVREHAKKRRPPHP